MSQKVFIIHIGYPKTGTKTLQKHLFQKHSGLNYLNIDLPFYGRINNEIYYSRENYIDRKKNNYKVFLKGIIDFFKNHDNPFVLSNESFTSHSMFFQFYPVPYVWTPEPNSIARKLHSIFFQSAIFSSVKIVVTIRRQDEMFKSIYAQVYNLCFKKIYETRNFNSFLHYSLEDNSGQFICDSLHYDNVIQCYETLFGEENVGVFVFEELKESPTNYIEKLAKFLKIDSNEAHYLLKGKNENQRSIYNDYYPSDDRNLSDFLIKFKYRFPCFKSFKRYKPFVNTVFNKIIIPGKKLKNMNIPNELKKKISDEFSKTNKKLSERRYLNLEFYDYF
jgi:hypothetical protein